MMNISNRRGFLRKAAVSGSSMALGLGSSAFSLESANTQASSPKSRVVYRDLGSTGYKISEISMGCMNMRDPELVHAAIDSGINYLDTAYVYMNGQNEEIIGQVMKTRRNKVFLTTKVGRFSSLRDISKDAPKEIETSLKRLQTDHVDLLLIHHGGDTPEKLLNEDLMKVLDDARRKGQTRFVGYSTHTSDPNVYEATIKSKFYDAVTICYNYASPQSLTKSIESMRKSGIGVIAMKTLLNFNVEPRKPLDDVREKGSKLTYSQALLKWVLSNPKIDTIISGMTSFEQLAENMSIMGKKMGYNDRLMLQKFSENTKGNHCFSLSGCTGCEGQCPKGVRICELNRCLGYAYGYDDERLAWENYKELPETNRVSNCGDCTECAIKCVNGINLTETVRRAKEMFG
jgi:uncharacterized protein